MPSGLVGGQRWYLAQWVRGVGQRLGPAWTSRRLGQWPERYSDSTAWAHSHLPDQLGEGPSGFLDSVKGSVQMLRKLREPLPSAWGPRLLALAMT